MKIKYQNILIHFIFTTEDRQPIIPEGNRDRIEKYITGIVNNSECKLYSIYINPEHMHLFASMDSSISADDLAKTISESSTKFINKNKLSIGNFSWQEEAAAFSVSKSDVNKLCKYIMNQKVHHAKQSFEKEYLQFIKFYGGDN